MSVSATSRSAGTADQAAADMNAADQAVAAAAKQAGIAAQDKEAADQAVRSHESAVVNKYKKAHASSALADRAAQSASDWLEEAETAEAAADKAAESAADWLEAAEATKADADKAAESATQSLTDTRAEAFQAKTDADKAAVAAKVTEAENAKRTADGVIQTAAAEVEKAKSAKTKAQSTAQNAATNVTDAENAKRTADSAFNAATSLAANATRPSIDQLRTWVRDHQRIAGIAGVFCVLLALLFGSGLGTRDGLDWTHVSALTKTIFSYARFWMVLFLAAAAVIFWMAEENWLRELAPWVLAIVGYLVAGAVVLNTKTASQLGLSDFSKQAKTFALISVAFLLLVASLVLRRISDGEATVVDLLRVRTGVGSTVLVLWTAVTLYGIALIGAFVILETLNGDASAAFDCTSATDMNCVTKDVWTDYLILLGVPGAAAAISKARNKEDEEDGSTRTDKTTAQSDNTTTAGGEATTTTAIADIQYLVFNAFGMLYVLASLVQYGRLPEIPDLVLALTGASALIYTVNRRVSPLPASK